MAIKDWFKKAKDARKAATEEKEKAAREKRANDGDANYKAGKSGSEQDAWVALNE